MRGYERDVDEYYDEYEDEGEEQLEGEEEEEEYEEEEERKPTAAELEYLALRARLKERIRKNRQMEGGSAVAKSQEKKSRFPFDNFGSFFGPSQPVIAQRVIQESKSLLENPHLAMKMATSNSSNKKSSASTAAGSRNGVSQLIPKFKKEMQVKVQKLKDTRDYSFLLSDDPDLPVPTKESVPRNVNAPSFEVRSAPMPQKSKQPSTINSRSNHGNHEERRSHSSMNGHMQSKSGQHKPLSATKHNSAPMDSRRQLGSNNGVGPGRPVGPKGLPAKPPVAILDKKVPASGSKSVLPALRKPFPSKMQSSVSKQPVQQRPMQQRPLEQRALEQRKGVQEPDRAKMMPKKPQVPLKPQINKPVKQVPSHGSLHDKRPKKKPMRPATYSDDEGDEALSIIRKMFNTQRYAGRGYDDDDDDGSDMLANFDDIMREERRSAKIAKEEDEEQARLIEEEERRERERMRMRKKRKLGQARQ